MGSMRPTEENTKCWNSVYSLGLDGNCSSPGSWPSRPEGGANRSCVRSPGTTTRGWPSGPRKVSGPVRDGSRGTGQTTPGPQYWYSPVVEDCAWAVPANISTASMSWAHTAPHRIAPGVRTPHSPLGNTRPFMLFSLSSFSNGVKPAVGPRPRSQPAPGAPALHQETHSLAGVVTVRQAGSRPDSASCFSTPCSQMFVKVLPTRCAPSPGKPRTPS